MATSRATKNRSFLIRCGCALNGIRVAVAKEASFRTELLIGIGAAAIFAWVRPPLLWVALCVLSAATSLALELLNTALERLADRLHPESHASIQNAKDCAAGAVLVASLGSAIIGTLTILAAFGWV